MFMFLFFGAVVSCSLLVSLLISPVTCHLSPVTCHLSLSHKERKDSRVYKKEKYEGELKILRLSLYICHTSQTPVNQ